MRDSSSIYSFCTQCVNDSFVQEPAQELSVTLCLACHAPHQQLPGFVEVTVVPHAVFLMQAFTQVAGMQAFTQIVGPSLMVS